MERVKILLVMLLLCPMVIARDIDVNTGFHEDFATDAYDTVHNEAWSNCEGCVHEYHSTGSWDGTGFARIFPPTNLRNPIPSNGGRNAISHGITPHANIIYYGAVIRLGPNYEETALNTGYRTQNKFIIIDVEGVDNNRGMTILEAHGQPMWMWNSGTTYAPSHSEWDYEQVCHEHVGYRPLQEHTATVENEPGTAGGAAYWQEDANLPCTVDDFSFGWCEDNTCSYDFDAFRTSDYEDQWIYLEIRADRTNSIASTSIYSMNGALSGVIGSRTANFQTPFQSIGVGYFFNGIHDDDPQNYIDIADIFMSDQPIGSPPGFLSGSPTYECNDGIDNDGDGNTDYGSDNGCTSSSDNDESNCNDGVCEGGETSETCPLDCGSAAVCGNGNQETGEQCDDGNTVTEACVYGQTSCIVCDSSCQSIAGATSYCGDGVCETEDCNSCEADCGVCEPTGDDCPNPMPEGMIACEGFENVAPGPVTEIDPTGSGQISRAARTFYGTGGNANGAFIDSGCNPGQCARAYVGPYIDGNSYTEPKWRFDNTIGGGKEVYVKFDLRVDSNLGTSNANREIINFKFIKPTDYITAQTSAPDGYGGGNLNLEPSDASYSWYGWGGSEYYMSRATTKLENHIMDNQWHTFEIYIDIGSNTPIDKYDESADGIIRLWEDSVLILEDTSVPMRPEAGIFTGINSLAFIRHAKSLGAPVSPIEGNIYFDNLEVWDRMPGFIQCIPVHDADQQPCDNEVDLSELIDYIDRWKAGEVSLQDVMGAIVEWKG